MSDLKKIVRGALSVSQDILDNGIGAFGEKMIVDIKEKGEKINPSKPHAVRTKMYGHNYTLCEGDVLCIVRKGGLYEHFGIYAGNDRVIHYSGDGDDFAGNVSIHEAPMSEFLEGQNEFYVLDFPVEDADAGIVRQISGSIVYGSMKDTVRNLMNMEGYKLYSPKETLERARSRIGETKYNFPFNNCEHFAVWCKTGLAESHQMGDGIAGVAGIIKMMANGELDGKVFFSSMDNLQDIIIKNGMIVDGSGGEPYKADIAILDGKISFIGNADGMTAKKEINAEGKYVTPGFIDTHSHSDSSIWINPEAQSSVRQGVTTEIVGNCGFSMRHTITVPFDRMGDGIECVYDLANKNVEIPKGAFRNTLDKMEKMGASVNTAWLCGHNDLRVIAGLNTTDYTDEQFDIMEGFIREAMEAGYIGFSTGLEFDPGILSRPEEVEKLASVAAEYDGIYTTHMRDEGTYILEAVEEFLNVIRKTKMRGMISHLNVKYDNGIPNDYLDKCMNMLKSARKEEGLDVFTDMLSTTYGTGCAQAMLPPWLYENGWDEARKILADDEGRARVKADMNRYWRFLDFGQWDRLLRIIAPHMPEVTAMSFEELCKEWNREPCDAFLDVFMKTETIEEVRAIEMVGVMFDEQTMIDTVVNDDIYLWMSDSYTTVEEGAARTGNMSDYMGYLYFFTRYVKELGVISIEKAVHKATKRVADHYRLEKRGQLKEGFYADINVFDLDNLKINATFTDPCKYCSGFDYVIVNGTPVIQNGEHTGKRSGMVLRRK